MYFKYISAEFCEGFFSHSHLLLLFTYVFAMGGQLDGLLPLLVALLDLDIVLSLY